MESKRATTYLPNTHLSSTCTALLAWWRYFVSGGVRVTHFHQFNADDDNSDSHLHHHHQARQRPQLYNVVTGLLLNYIIMPCYMFLLYLSFHKYDDVLCHDWQQRWVFGTQVIGSKLRTVCLNAARAHTRAFRIIIMYSLRFINICDDDVGCQVECVSRRMPCRRFMRRDDAWIIRMQINFAHLKTRSSLSVYQPRCNERIIIESGPTEICFFRSILLTRDSPYPFVYRLNERTRRSWIFLSHSALVLIETEQCSIEQNSISNRNDYEFCFSSRDVLAFCLVCCSKVPLKFVIVMMSRPLCLFRKIFKLKNKPFHCYEKRQIIYENRIHEFQIIPSFIFCQMLRSFAFKCEHKARYPIVGHEGSNGLHFGSI